MQGIIKITQTTQWNNLSKLAPSPFSLPALHTPERDQSLRMVRDPMCSLKHKKANRLRFHHLSKLLNLILVLESLDQLAWAQSLQLFKRPTSTMTTDAMLSLVLRKSLMDVNPLQHMVLAPASAPWCSRETSLTETLDVQLSMVLPPRTKRLAKKPSPQLPLVLHQLSSPLSASELLSALPTPSEQPIQS